MKKKDRLEVELFIDYAIRELESFLDVLNFVRINVDTEEELYRIKVSIKIIEERIKLLDGIESVEDAKKLLRPKKAAQLSRSLKLSESSEYRDEFL